MHGGAQAAATQAGADPATAPTDAKRSSDVDMGEASDDTPHTLRLTFHEQDFAVFPARSDHGPVYLAARPDADEPERVAAPELVVPEDAYWDPLESFFAALRVPEALGEFLDTDTALSLAFPDLDLSVQEDDMYTREISLHDVCLLALGFGIQASVQVVVTQVLRFISRYNELATMMNDADEASWEAHSGVEIEDDTDAADEPPSDARAAGAGKEQAEEGSEAGVDEDEPEVGRRGAGDHVARVLHVPRAVGEDEAAAGGREVAVGDVDGDALLALGTQAVDKQREVHAVEAAVGGGALHGLHLVCKHGLGVIEQAADEGGLAVINGAGGAQAQGIALLEGADIRREGGGHQK